MARDEDTVTRDFMLPSFENRLRVFFPLNDTKAGVSIKGWSIRPARLRQQYSIIRNCLLPLVLEKYSAREASAVAAETPAEEVGVQIHCVHVRIYVYTTIYRYIYIYIYMICTWEL